MDLLLEISKVIGFAAVFLAILAIIAGKVGKKALEKTVEHAFDRNLERYKNSLQHQAVLREKASVVAAVISEWASKPDDPKELNRLIWEASLWLPEPQARKLNRLLQHDDAETWATVLADVRRAIFDSQSKMQAADFTGYTKEGIQAARMRRAEARLPKAQTNAAT